MPSDECSERFFVARSEINHDKPDEAPTNSSEVWLPVGWQEDTPPYSTI